MTLGGTFPRNVITSVTPWSRRSMVGINSSPILIASPRTASPRLMRLILNLYA